MAKKQERKNRRVLILVLTIVLIIVVGVSIFSLYLLGYIGPKQTQLFNAAYMGNWGRFGMLIYDYNDFGAVDRYGQTLFHLACYQANDDIVKRMISQGASVNTREKSRIGGTPLYCAAQTGHVKVAQILLDNVAQVNAKDNYGWTPLHKAVSKQLEEMVRLLLKNGADVNITSTGGWTPLHQALKSPYRTKPEIVELLIQYGADVNQSNPSGKSWDSQHDSHPFRRTTAYMGDTPLEIAINKGYDDIVDLLQKHGAK